MSGGSERPDELKPESEGESEVLWPENESKSKPWFIVWKDNEGIAGQTWRAQADDEV